MGIENERKGCGNSLISWGQLDGTYIGRPASTQAGKCVQLIFANLVHNAHTLQYLSRYFGVLLTDVLIHREN